MECHYLASRDTDWYITEGNDVKTYGTCNAKKPLEAKNQLGIDRIVVQHEATVAMAENRSGL
jgi:hypothetical protein